MTIIETYNNISTCLANTFGIGGMLYGFFSFLKNSINVDKFSLKKV